jgi:hypothetical protein
VMGAAGASSFDELGDIQGALRSPAQ